MARLMWLAVLLLWISAPGCQALSGSAGAAGAPAPLALLPDFPAPAALKAPADATYGMFRYGAQYEELLPHQHVAAQADDSAEFTPDWSGQASGLGGLAYAIYFFDISGQVPDGQLRFEWGQAGSFADAWVGLPSPDDTHWDWHPVPADGALEYNVGETLNSASEHVIVLLTGTALWRLDSLRLFEPTPPRITGVTPAGGAAGGWGSFSAVNTGGTVASWSWDFGGGAHPGTSLMSTPGVIFGPAGEYSASVSATNQAGQDVYEWTLTNTSLAELYSASGTVLKQDSTPYGGCYLNLAGPTPGTLQADAAGCFSGVFLRPGDYTLTPSGGTFSPGEHTFTIAGADVSGLDFQQTGAVPHHITGGVVLVPDGFGMSGATLTLSGTEERITTSGSVGSYGFFEVPDGPYRITPSFPGSPVPLYFAPPYRDFNVAGANISVNFICSLTPLELYDVSGVVTEEDSGQPVAGLTIELSNFWRETTVTAADGSYHFYGLAPGDHSITPADPLEQWYYTPPVYNVGPDSDRDDLDFTRHPSQ